MKKRNYSLIIGLILTGIILIITIIGQFWTPYAVTGMDSLAKNQAPSLIHLMGTDNFGRDVFSRVMNGCRHNLFCGTFHCGDRLLLRCYHRLSDRILWWSA